MTKIDQRQLARDVVRQLWQEGVSAGVPDDPRTPGFADEALKELQRLWKSTPGILKDVMDGAEIGASQLNVDPMHGLAELVQNADDLHATEIKMSVRSRGEKRDLVAVHNGRPVCIQHVLAMAMAFVSTKRGDPLSTGKFGIGLKTLSRIADSIEVSCSPYHFVVTGNRISRRTGPLSIPKIYDPASQSTLIVVPLRESESALKAEQWARSWTATKMLFLQSVTTLSWVDPATGRTVVRNRISKKKIDASPPWRLQGQAVETLAFTVRDRTDNLSWIRYDAKVSIPRRIRRAFKATGTEAMISVAMPESASQNALYARLPTSILIQIPFSINAPFDLNTARTEIQGGPWNDWLWKRISQFLGELSIYLLESNPTVAWYFCPTENELTVEGDSAVGGWLMNMRDLIHDTVRRRGVLKLNGNTADLAQLSYEVSALDGLLVADDYRSLTDGKAMLPQQARDSGGRWRVVLDDQQVAACINVDDALGLFVDKESTIRQRAPQWFVQLAAAALDANLAEALRQVPCVLTDNPRMALSPAIECSGSKLAGDPGSATLAYRLGLVHQLHPVYFRSDVSSEKVRSWLQELGLLVDVLDDASVLRIIAEMGSQNRVSLADADLIELRDTVDRVEADVDRDVMKAVGRAVALDAFEWVGGRRVSKKATISSAYLPAAIDRELGGWPKIADKTRGLTWVAPRYASLLNPRSRESGVSGARRLLNLLGAMTSPFLAFAPQEPIPHTWSPSSSDTVPTLQHEAFIRLEKPPDRLIGDYASPDLERVVDDICRAKPAIRRRRGLYLFGMLNRLWPRSYQRAATCMAGYFYHRINELGDVPCTWIARLADAPWLQSESGTPVPPRLLDIRSPLTEGLYGNARDRFAWGISHDKVEPGLAAALGLQQRPKVSAVVDRLSELRKLTDRPDDLQIRGIYQYISRLCPESSTSAASEVDDMTVAQLRRKFGTGAHRTGLLWSGDRWRTPSQVRLGRPIFGNRRPFVAESQAMDRLWRVLLIRKPSIADCVQVLHEIAANASPQQERGVLTDVYRHMNALIPGASNKERNVLASIPVSIGKTWTTGRPVYVLDDPAARDSVLTQLPVWHPPCSLDGMDAFVDACGLSRIPADRSEVMGIDTTDVIAGRLLTPEFQNAVDALQDYLAQNEPSIYQDIVCGWPELRDAKLVISKALELEVSLPDGSVFHSACDAHVVLNPLTIYLRDPKLLFELAGGGRAIAQCFRSYQHRHIVSLAWCNPAVRASLSGAKPMTLAVEGVDDEDPLDIIGKSVGRKVGIPIAAGRQDHRRRSDTALPVPVATPRRLKSLDSIVVSKSSIVNRSSAPGKPKPSHKSTLREPGDRGTEIVDGRSSKLAPMGYTDHDREQLALRLLAAVVKEHKRELKDFTKLKMVGADTGDDLSRFFEVKAYSGEMPDVVSIEPSQALRAQRSGKDFYLAVIAGLEEGYPTVIKLFSKPLDTLDWMSGTSVKLAGIKSKRALEIHIESAEALAVISATAPDVAAAESTGESARVPMMITGKMEAQLYQLGYTEEQIRKMTPQDAWKCLT